MRMTIATIALLLVACTTPHAPVAPTASPTEAAASRARAGAATSEASTGRCRVSRSINLDGLARARSPEEALAGFEDDVTQFDAVVRRRGVHFYAPDGRISYEAEQVGARWMVSVINEPGCRPVVLGRAAEVDPRDLACKREHFIIFGGSFTNDSVLEAMAWYVSRRRIPPSGARRHRGPYVLVAQERDRGRSTFGRIDDEGLQSVVTVWSTKRGTAIESVGWC